MSLKSGKEGELLHYPMPDELWNKTNHHDP